MDKYKYLRTFETETWTLYVENHQSLQDLHPEWHISVIDVLHYRRQKTKFFNKLSMTKQILNLLLFPVLSSFYFTSEQTRTCVTTTIMKVHFTFHIQRSFTPPSSISLILVCPTSPHLSVRVELTSINRLVT